MSKKGERLRTFRENLGFSQKAFSEKYQTAQRNISKYETGLTSIPDDLEEKLAMDGLDLHWLATGEGQMFHSDLLHGIEFVGGEKKSQMGNSFPFEDQPDALRSNTVLHLPPSAPDRSLPPESTAMAVSGRDRGPPGIALGPPEDDECGDQLGARMEGMRSIDLSVQRNGSDAVSIDFYTGMTAGAGPGQDVDAYQPTTPLEIMRRFIQPWRPDQVRALEVRGDSMTKVGLFDRDIALFVPSECEGDGIFVISIEGRMQVKRLEFDLLGKTLRIISENDRYQPRVLSEGDEIDRVRIEGKVVGWLHRHPY